MKSRFPSEEAANAYKDQHQLFGRVAEHTGGGKWALVFPIAAHLEVRPGAPTPEDFQRLAQEKQPPCKTTP